MPNPKKPTTASGIRGAAADWKNGGDGMGSVALLIWGRWSTETVVSAPPEHQNLVLHLLYEAARTPTAGDRQIKRPNLIKSEGMTTGFNPHQRWQPPFITMASGFVPISPSLSTTTMKVDNISIRRPVEQPQRPTQTKQ
ncbi:hypothetical protein ACLOJK_036347 [Asimina triloba]